VLVEKVFYPAFLKNRGVGFEGDALKTPFIFSKLTRIWSEVPTPTSPALFCRRQKNQMKNRVVIGVGLMVLVSASILYIKKSKADCCVKQAACCK
jgi:hypothetical protein